MCPHSSLWCCHCVSIKRWDLERWLGHEGPFLVNDITCPLEEHSKGSRLFLVLPPSSTRGHCSRAPSRWNANILIVDSQVRGSHTNGAHTKMGHIVFNKSNKVTKFRSSVVVKVDKREAAGPSSVLTLSDGIQRHICSPWCPSHTEVITLQVCGP